MRIWLRLSLLVCPFYFPLRKEVAWESHWKPREPRKLRERRDGHFANHPFEIQQIPVFRGNHEMIFLKTTPDQNHPLLALWTMVRHGHFLRSFCLLFFRGKAILKDVAAILPEGVLDQNGQNEHFGQNYLILNRWVHQPHWSHFYFLGAFPGAISRLSLKLFFGLPHKQQIGVKHFWARESELERNADKFGREFWAWILGGCLKPWKTRPKHLQKKTAIKLRWEIRRLFS